MYNTIKWEIGPKIKEEIRKFPLTHSGESVVVRLYELPLEVASIYIQNGYLILVIDLKETAK